MTGKRANSEINPPSADVYDLLQQLADSDAALVALKDAQGISDPPVNALSSQLLDQIQNTLIQSKELLEKMLSSMQVGTAYLDPHFNYIWVNPAFANQRCGSPDDFVGRSHFEVNPGLENEHQIRMALEEGEPIFIAAQAVAIPENSEIRVWDRSFQPVKGSRGTAGLMYTEHDVTDHIRLSPAQNEEHLLQQELLQAVFDVDPAGLAVLSGHDLIFKFANAKFRSYLPQNQNDPIGESLYDVWPEEKSFLSSLLAKNTRVDVNHQERQFPDGSRRWFSYHIRPMQWKDEPAFMVNMWDATEDQAVYLNIQAAAADAERRAEELNAVISAMSEAVTIFDINGQPVLVNPATIQAYGFDPITIPREKAIQKLSVRRMNGEPVKEHELPSARALKGERVHHEQLVFINRENHEQIILASASPLYNEGRLFGAVTVWTDVTEREELLHQIKTERSRLSTMIANAPVGIVAIDREGDLLIANSMSAELWGQSSSENDSLLEQQNTMLDGTPFYPIDFARDAIGGEAQINQEIVIQKPNGERDYLLLNSAPIVNAKGNVEGAVAIFQEITAQKLAEQNLWEANERFALVLKNSPVMVYKTDLDLRYIWVYNPQYGTSEAMIGRRDDELAGADDVKALTAFKRSVLMSRKGDRQEIQMTFNGGQMIYDVTAEPLYDDQGEIAGLTVAAVDITEQKRVKDEMTKKTARIEVQRHLIRQRELERQQIARDLHDGPLQELIGINYGLREALDIPHRRQRRVKVDEIQDGLQELIQEMRAFCSELRPPTLAPFGLEKAIRSHIEIFHEKNPSIQVDLDLSIDQDQLPEEVRMALYRIYQELLTNIMKHAKASSVSVRFNFDQRQAELEVADNGIGFIVPNDWVETARQGHLGLVGIFERTEAVGGSISILSKPGAGTIVKVIVPAPPNLNTKGSDSGS